MTKRTFELNDEEIDIISKALLKYRINKAEETIKLISDPEAMIKSTEEIMKISSVEEKFNRFLLQLKES